MEVQVRDAERGVLSSIAKLGERFGASGARVERALSVLRDAISIVQSLKLVRFRRVKDARSAASPRA
ncbi:hypothetical protein [Actinomadura opuntiae]|uniref:hypothetical protein n=1 Tax=Actinomadura sp. OS1-43 TaxID=604315 RepID=UPI00255B186C|nr:hypothetical protein [Actinomadura sp. OS1-43]MDL4813408.1 hypothetical protein [Actinomadura sp. OS1-43]